VGAGATPGRELQHLQTPEETPGYSVGPHEARGGGGGEEGEEKGEEEEETRGEGDGEESERRTEGGG